MPKKTKKKKPLADTFPIVGEPRKITWSDENEKQVFEATCFHLGLSRSFLVNQLIGERHERILNDSKEVEKLKKTWAGQKFLSLLEEKSDIVKRSFYESHPLKLPEQRGDKNHLGVTFSLGFYPQDKDPIQLTFNEVVKLSGLSKSSFFRSLYYKFLFSNDLFAEQETLIENYQRAILLRLDWKPYRWKAPPIENFNDVIEGPLRFYFLSDGGFGNHKSETIRLRDHGIDPIRETLPLICSVLWRNHSELFKMLYMYFLKEHDILNSEFELKANFLDKISQVTKWNLHKLKS